MDRTYREINWSDKDIIVVSFKLKNDTDIIPLIQQLSKLKGVSEIESFKKLPKNTRWSLPPMFDLNKKVN